MINLYQNSIYVLGAVEQQPINLNLYQNSIYVLGTDYVPPFNENFTPSGSLILSGDSIIKQNYNNYSSGSLILSGDSIIKQNYNSYSSGSLLLSGLSNISLILSNSQQSFLALSSGNLILSGLSISKIDNGEINYYFTGGQNNGYYLTDFRITFETNQTVEFELKSSDKNAKFENIKNISYNDTKIYEFKYIPFYQGESEISVTSQLPLNGNPIIFNYISEHEKNGINPKIKFKVNFKKNNVDENIAITQTTQVKGYNKTLKHNDEFFLYGKDAIFAKNNLEIFCLEILEE
jgi:hypothetical protein